MAARTLDQYRTDAFKLILSRAFKAFPSKVEEVLVREDWKKFTDFMEGVEHSGRVLKSLLGMTLEEANDDAMFKLLSGAFYGPQDGDLDPDLSAEDLKPLGIAHWVDLAKAVLEVAVMDHWEATGRAYLEGAKKPTRAFFEMKPDASEEEMKFLVDSFGLATPDHLTALLTTAYNAELTPEDLDQAVGDPALLTLKVNRCPSNPYKNIVFGFKPAMSGIPRGKRPLGIFKDLDSPSGRPGEMVAVFVDAWEDPKSAVVEGWRGPDFESEDFAKSRLQPVECGQVLVDMTGYWECIGPGIKVY